MKINILGNSGVAEKILHDTEVFEIEGMMFIIHQSLNSRWDNEENKPYQVTHYKSGMNVPNCISMNKQSTKKMAIKQVEAFVRAGKDFNTLETINE